MNKQYPGLEGKKPFTAVDMLDAARCEFSFLTRLFSSPTPPAARVTAPALEGTQQHLTSSPLSFSDGTFHAEAERLIAQGHGKYTLVGCPCEPEECIGALLNLAGCLVLGRNSGLKIDSRVILPLLVEGEKVQETHNLQHVIPLWKQRAHALEDLVTSFLPKDFPQGQPTLDWFDHTIKRCGTCLECAEQISAHRDLLLVEGMGLKTRALFIREYGISTVEQLAEFTPPENGLPVALARLKAQAEYLAGLTDADPTIYDYPDDSALLRSFSYEPDFTVEDELAQSLLTAAGKEEEAGQAEAALEEYLAGLEGKEPLEGDALSIALVASATGYHRRERSQFWTDHFHRLADDISSWEGTRNVAVFDSVEVAENWARDPDRPRAQPTRLLKIRAWLGEGSSLKPGNKGLFLMYRAPFPPHVAQDFRRQLAKAEDQKEFSSVRFGAFKADLVEISATPQGGYDLLVRESLPRGGEEFEQLPMALSPAQPLQTKAQEQALARLAEQVALTLPGLPQTAATDILGRRRPRLRSQAHLPQREVEKYGSAATIEAVYAAVKDLDSSYLAVQGPPGSGKTYLGAHVIGRLIDRGWKIGVVAQSHAVVENVLAGCIEKGTVAPEQVAKFKGKSQLKDAPWREVTEAELASALDSEDGFLLGGTAWDFSSEKKFPDGALNLLVIDEAGQYSLANTLAVARSARNMLLLGDPQQLPQVTQGEHDYPVDESALGWLCDGHDTLPEYLGYFLDVSWRMHPALCRPVSALSYDGKLGAAEAGSQRHLADWEPGVYRREITHSGNTTSSAEEAREVVRLVQKFLGRTWTAHTGQGQSRSLQEADILVVAAYNAQVDLITEHLAGAGLSGIRVGTVDKFQGQEAPVVLVSLAASSGGDSSRGAEFLLSPHRLNVALSRGQWCAVLIQSSTLTDFIPTTVEGLDILGKFIELNNSAKSIVEN